MAGHNKWSKIKNKKGAADAKRGAIFSRLGKAITIAAREGGGDVGMNFKLRVAVDAAKAANMPNDNIERAIKRGTGEDGGGEMLEGVYEAYGPGGVAIVIETLSDNKNRVVADVTATLKRAGATPADQGSVLFGFEKKAVVSVAAEQESGNALNEDLELAVIDAGAEDIDQSDDGWIVTGPMEAFQRIVECIEGAGLALEEAGIQFVANTPIQIDDATQEKVDRIIEALEELDDVQSVYTSAA